MTKKKQGLLKYTCINKNKQHTHQSILNTSNKHIIVCENPNVKSKTYTRFNQTSPSKAQTNNYHHVFLYPITLWDAKLR